MKKFLKKSSVIILVLIILVSTFIFVFATNTNDDTKQNEKNIAVSQKIVKVNNNVLKKSKKTKENYSDTIHVLVTSNQKKTVSKKIKAMNNEIEMLAKVIYREARGENKEYQSAVAWCVLNRVDNKGYGNTIEKVITSPNQFAWIPNTPITKEQKEIATDVITRWLLEKEGIENVGRTLPKSYKFFAGDGVHNYFRKEFKSTEYWDWKLESPY